MTPPKKPARKKTSIRLKNTPRVPSSRKAKAKRRKMIEQHITSLDRIVYCPALKSNVLIEKSTRKEIQFRASSNKDSTLFALNIEHLLKTATLHEIRDSKPNVNQQARFDKMYILSQYVKKHGTAKITIGHFRNPEKHKEPYCQYCVTRWNLKKQKK